MKDTVSYYVHVPEQSFSYKSLVPWNTNLNSTL